MSDAAEAEVPFANYQYEIYLAGMAGQRPEHPMAWPEWERLAYERLDEGARGYVEGAAGTGATLRANRAALDRWQVVPRMLRDVGRRSIGRTVLGRDLPAPLLLAPVGVQSIVHAEGELASARAASALGLAFTASTAASFTLEQIAEAAADGPRLYQLYWPRDPELAASFVSRAEAAGYAAIVVTLDTALLAWRPRDLAGAYLPFLEGIGIANYLADPVFCDGLPEGDVEAAVGRFVGVFSNPSVTWDDLAWLRGQTDLPIVLKGILHADDARRAAELGVDGLIVSNHGGRQVDGAIGALDALPAVLEAAGAELEVLFDSGVRGGADAFKALALGARAVLIGRPFLWGLAVDGEAGVRTVLRSLLAELDLTLALSGYRSLDELGPEALVRAPS